MLRRLEHSKYLLSFFYGILFLLMFFTSVEAKDMIPGSKGAQVLEVQRYLYQLKYLKSSPTGYYGSLTVEAVRSFQMEYSLKSDGIIGTDTLSALKEAVNSKRNMVEYIVKPGDKLTGIAEKYRTSVAAIMARNNLTTNEVTDGQRLKIIPGENSPRLVSSRSGRGLVQETPWTIVNQLWKTGEVARIIDVETGKSFQARRFYGYYHADTEPLTAVDSRILLDIYGGHWSWNRRAVIVQIRNQYIAASINGMPHGKQSIYNNQFSGQFCAHFLGSRIHKNGRVDQTHQAMVEQAANVDLATLVDDAALEENGVTLTETATATSPDPESSLEEEE